MTYVYTLQVLNLYKTWIDLIYLMIFWHPIQKARQLILCNKLHKPFFSLYILPGPPF